MTEAPVGCIVKVGATMLTPSVAALLVADPWLLEAVRVYAPASAAWALPMESVVEVAPAMTLPSARVPLESAVPFRLHR